MYVATDSRPVIGHHLRGAKMALWLDLIPKIHRSDNLDQRFHLLDNFDDVDSFDADGVDLSRLDELRRTYATSTAMPPANSTTTAPRKGNAVARSRPPPPSKPSPLPSRRLRRRRRRRWRRRHGQQQFAVGGAVPVEDRRRQRRAPVSDAPSAAGVTSPPAVRRP